MSNSKACLFLVCSLLIFNGCSKKEPTPEPSPKPDTIVVHPSDKDYTIAPPALPNETISHSPINWRWIGQGLEFCRVVVYCNNQPVDSVAVVRIHCDSNRFRVVTGWSPNAVGFEMNNIVGWQRKTGAAVVFNGPQYKADPWGMPMATMVCDGKIINQKGHPWVKGMLVAEPKREGLPQAALLDFRYDDSLVWRSYNQGAQHWPILLDRHGNVRAKSTSNWQANRTVVAQDRKGRILVFCTEGGFFTLYNFGRFLKASEFEIKTAMNMDGGYEAELMVVTDSLVYLTYGQFETQGPDRDISIPGARCHIPTVIAVYPKDKKGEE